MIFEDKAVPIPGGICDMCMNDPEVTHELCEGLSFPRFFA